MCRMVKFVGIKWCHHSEGAIPLIMLVSVLWDLAAPVRMIMGRACCGMVLNSLFCSGMAGAWLKVTEIREMVAVSVQGRVTQSGSEAVPFHGLSREPVCFALVRSPDAFVGGLLAIPCWL